ncbi:MAG TPA: hypothetical protein VMB24_05720 [Dehalococcoidales bacterium]|nr:hypothetical protein [Dehalococcoidales bacterium]
MGFFRILTAIPGFFLSAFFLMLFWGIVAKWISPSAYTISYVNAMFVTLGLWLAVAPLAGAGGHWRRHKQG